MTRQQELIPKGTGDYLKQIRKSRGLKLATVARALSLDESLLKALEDGETLEIASIYRSGYIRSYARYLKVPEEEIPALVSTVTSEAPLLQSVFQYPPKRSPADKWLRATSYVLASLLIGTLAWQFTHEAVRLSQGGVVLESAQESTSGAVRQQRPGQPINASIASLGVLHGDSENTVDTARQAWDAVNRPAQPALPEGQSHMQVSVSADCWVEISDSRGEELEMDLLRAGSSKEYHGTPPFRVLFGHAPAVSLLVNGEAVDLAPFTRDKIVQMSWPPQETPTPE